MELKLFSSCCCGCFCCCFCCCYSCCCCHMIFFLLFFFCIYNVSGQFFQHFWSISFFRIVCSNHIFGVKGCMMFHWRYWYSLPANFVQQKKKMLQKCFWHMVNSFDNLESRMVCMNNGVCNVMRHKYPQNICSFFPRFSD